MNRLLRHVLHAIQVLPLRFPDGLPADYGTRVPPGHSLPFESESAWSHEERDRAAVARSARPTALGREVEERFSKQTLQELMRYQLRPDGSFVRREYIHPAQELAPLPDSVLEKHLDEPYLRLWHKKRRDRYASLPPDHRPRIKKVFLLINYIIEKLSIHKQLQLCLFYLYR